MSETPRKTAEELDADAVESAYQVLGRVDQENSENQIPEDLPGDKRERVLALRTALAEKYGLAPEDFGIVRISDPLGYDDDQFVVALTTGSGIRLGSYNSIRNPRTRKRQEEFQITVDGHRINTRAMTGSIYEAFISGEKSRGIKPLPDSQQLAEQEGGLRTATYLLYESPILNRSLAYVSGGDTRFDSVSNPDRDVPEFRFRPAVKV